MNAEQLIIGKTLRFIKVCIPMHGVFLPNKRKSNIDPIPAIKYKNLQCSKTSYNIIEDKIGDTKRNDDLTFSLLIFT